MNGLNQSGRIVQNMKLKEKTKTEIHKNAEHKKEMPMLLKIFLALLSGYLAAGTSIGNGVPLCTAITAVLPVFGGVSVFAGAMASFLISGDLFPYITEIISMPAVIFSRTAVTVISGKRISSAGAAALSCSAYIICGIIASFFCEISAALVAAIFFRGAISGCAAYFFTKASAGGFRVNASGSLSVAVVYSFLICMLCGINIGIVNPGRIFGLFITAAAAYRYGLSYGSIVGGLSVFSFGMVSPSMAATSAIAVCSGLAAGIVSKKGRLFSAAAFIGTALAGSLVYGMPSDAMKLVPDAVFAAIIFCVIPDAFLRRSLSSEQLAPSSAVKLYGNRLRFAASAVSDVKSSFSRAADIFDGRKQENDIASEVCDKVCSLCRSSTFCGESEEHRIRTYLQPAEDILEKKGYITENELHKGLEGCTQKNMIAEAFNDLYRLSVLEKRSGSITECMREITLEQLSGTEDMLNYFGRNSEQFPGFDETLSDYVREALSDFGAISPSAAVFSDNEGHVYVECFYEGLLKVKLEAAAEKIGSICDRDFGNPEVISFNRITRLCFCELPVFEAETGRMTINGREKTSGDTDHFFRDGFGNVYLLISDGMGSGVKAAVESCMTVSLMTRIIRAGLGVNAAIRLINLLLLTKSADESFATVDLMKLNLFSGKAEIIKLGAAQTFIRSNGTVKTVESWSTPVGIVSSVEVSKRNIQLSDGDEIVMITDGIGEECFPKVRELMLSRGLTAQDCAERIVAYAENYNSGKNCHKDDKTVCVVKLHKI